MNFHDVPLTIEYDQYAKNKRTAITLYEKETGEPFMVATVNLPNVILKDNEVLIKNYSENQGVYEAMIAQGIIKPGVAVDLDIYRAELING